jgi:hypothetical protein
MTTTKIRNKSYMIRIQKFSIINPNLGFLKFSDKLVGGLNKIS